MNLPITLAAKQAIQVPVTSSPETTGSVAGSLTITSNAQAGTTNISLSGTGIANSVTLSWTDTGASIAGYNVYRSTVSGNSYSKLNAAPVSSPSYSDSGVASGASYFYVVTAVGKNGMESVYSNKDSVIVP
jgi:fibronectin type 3 domain-containing protein